MSNSDDQVHLHRQDREKGKIDVLISTYNGEKYLIKQLESIFGQTNDNFLLIARDDGSSDSTIDILKEYVDKYKNKIILIPCCDRLGVVGSFSKLMEYSTAEYIAFCDQDDIWASNKLEYQLTVIKKAEHLCDENTPLLVHSDLVVVSHDENTISPSFWAFQGIDPDRNQTHHLLVENTVTGCSAFFNRALKKAAWPIPMEAEMHDYWLALVASVVGAVIPIKEPLVQYRQHGKNVVGATQIPRLACLPRGPLTPRNWKIDYRRACRQAAILVERLSPVVPQPRLDCAVEFASLYRHGWLGRRRVLIANEILPARWRRRLSVLARI